MNKNYLDIKNPRSLRNYLQLLQKLDIIKRFVQAALTCRSSRRVLWFVPVNFQPAGKSNVLIIPYISIHLFDK
jgi:hypothetical protein